MIISDLYCSDTVLKDVPDPVKYFVTHWSKDSWSRMSYSFVKTGGSGEAYDIIAEDVQGKLFFAGEVRLPVCLYVYVRCSCSDELYFPVLHSEWENTRTVEYFNILLVIELN